MNVSTSPARERVVVVGGGFAGLNFIKRLDNRKFHIILIDKDNYHSFPPLFYQVASSGLDPTSIAFPLRCELRRHGDFRGEFHLGEVRSVDTAARTVTTQFETIPYDRLVIAAGTTNNFFGDPSLRDRVYTLKSTGEAIRIRNAVLDRFERAAIEPDPERRRRLLSFVIIGGGPAGVEIAGAIGEMKRYVISREYPGLSPADCTVTLLEGTDRLLRTMSELSSADALSGLSSLMVDIRLNTLMKSYDGVTVVTDKGESLSGGMVIWTAGIKGVEFSFSGCEYKPGPGGRIPADEFCCAKDMEGVYVLGDIGFTPTERYPRGYPQLAQVAIQQGRYLARCLNRGRADRPFRYRDKGSMATIGRNRAVADIGRLHLSGWIAWMAWMMVHLISLLGMRSKMSVLTGWMWAYFTYNTSLRLLLRADRFPKEE